MKTSSVRLGLLTRVVAVLALLEFTSGVLQGYFTPMMSDIAQRLQVSDADVNWLESAQLPLAAIAVPVLAKLGDMVGHRRVLLGSTALTAAFAVLVFSLRTADQPSGGRFNWVGLMLGASALAAIRGGFSLMRLHRIDAALPWVVLVVGLVLLVPFVRWELRHPDPFIDVRLFKNPALVVVFLVAALPTVAVMFAPEGRNGVVTGLTGSMKTTGGAIASAVFGIALARGIGDNGAGAAGSMQGYYTVWAICGLTSLLGASVFFLSHRRQVRRHAQSH